MVRKFIYVFCILLLCKSACFAFVNNSFGIDTDRNRWGIIIREVYPNYPAFEAGISDGDYILNLNKIDVTGMSFNDFCYLLKKSSNKPVNLKIRRGEDVLNFDIKPIDIWKVYINNFSDILINQIDSRQLPQFYTSKYKIRIKNNKAEASLVSFEYNDNEKYLYDDDYIKAITDTAVKKAGALPDNYDEAVFEVEFSRDGIDNKINTKLISKYKKASVKLFNDTDKFANFTDIINSFKQRKDVRNIEMTLVYKGLIPAGEVYDGNVLSYTNLKTTDKNHLLRILDKISEIYSNYKETVNPDGNTVKMAGYSEIDIKIYPVKFNNVQFEVYYKLKPSKGYFYKYTEKAVVTPNQVNYPYYVSEIELRPVNQNKIITAENFSKSLYSYYKKSFPDVVLEKIKSENSVSKTDCFAMRGKDTVIEVIPNKTNTSFIVRYYSLLDVKEFNKEYQIFLKTLNR